MAKKAVTPKPSETSEKAPESNVSKLVKIICSSQGVGQILAESIASSLTAEQQEKVIALAASGAAADVIHANLANPKKVDPESQPGSNPPAE